MGLGLTVVCWLDACTLPSVPDQEKENVFLKGPAREANYHLIPDLDFDWTVHPDPSTQHDWVDSLPAGKRPPPASVLVWRRERIQNRIEPPIRRV